VSHLVGKEVRIVLYIFIADCFGRDGHNHHHGQECQMFHFISFYP
jgi:hypothetical protein